MKLADINPFLRFAGQVTYSAKDRHVYVRDCRLFYILGGKGKIYIDDKQLSLSPNTVFYCRCGSDYTIETEDTIRLYSLNFDLSQAERHLTMTFVPQEFDCGKKSAPANECNVTDSPFLNSYFILENGVEFENILIEIVREFAEQHSYFRESCSAKLKGLLTGLHKADTEKTGNSPDVIGKVLDYIRQNYMKELKNSELAKLAGYHEYYLNRLFVKHTGVSMHKYILNMRISEGERLLLNTDMPISEIAAKTGFNSSTHFATYFKKEMNMTPFQYRDNFKNNI